MTRGPRPMPLNMRVLQGGRSASPDRINPAQPKPKAATPKPPRDLDERDRGYWREFCSRVDELGVGSIADAGLVRIWVAARRRWVDADVEVRKRGVMMRGTKYHPGPRRNPALFEIHKAEGTMIRIEIEFGLSPSSRTRVASSNGET